MDETPLARRKPPSTWPNAWRWPRPGRWHSASPAAVVIGSDQVADLNGEALGKPGTHARAVAQLHQMRGQTVVFQTAVAVVCLETGFCQKRWPR